MQQADTNQPPHPLLKSHITYAHLFQLLHRFINCWCSHRELLLLVAKHDGSSGEVLGPHTCKQVTILECVQVSITATNAV